MTQVATITWVDPAVEAGQAALQTLDVYGAAVGIDGNVGPLVLLGTVLPGVQTFTTAIGQLASGSTYYFTVKATDINGLHGPQGNWAGPIGPVGVPSAPINVQVTFG